MSNLRDRVLEEPQKGNIVLSTFDGLQIVSLNEFVTQPAEGILYDLNRLPEVIMTFIDDPKWVNDYAVSMVIRRLREAPSELEAKMEQSIKHGDLERAVIEAVKVWHLNMKSPLPRTIRIALDALLEFENSGKFE